MNDPEHARLQQQYPDWYIRRPPTMACFVATRLRPLTEREIFYGLHATLVEDTRERLSEALATQHEIEEAL
ncbi:hypothetical protein [Actinomadura fibrosa]|uniref:Uncharacterized protein n=1 Tax=Actinomadura fibrosa TaxID=111802 RepID=A0ABW2XFS0_9ACTN|nr:hypothetical protein [Actinomadura fibrosa]